MLESACSQQEHALRTDTVPDLVSVVALGQKIDGDTPMGSGVSFVELQVDYLEAQIRIREQHVADGKNRSV